MAREFKNYDEAEWVRKEMTVKEAGRQWRKVREKMSMRCRAGKTAEELQGSTTPDTTKKAYRDVPVSKLDVKK